MKASNASGSATFKRARVAPAHAVTELSSCDKTAMAIATCRALFYPLSATFHRFNDDIMGQAIEQLVTDCPIFGGRVRKLTPTFGWSISDMAIDNVNTGIEFKIVNNDANIASMMDPSAWTMKNINIDAPRFPPYLPSLDSGPKLLKGQEPMCKVQLTHLEDGDILAVSMSHMLTDGMHWPQFMTHLAARYKELATDGAFQAPPDKLMAWDGNKSHVNYTELRKVFLEKGMLESSWEPAPIEVKPTFMDHVRAWMLLIKNSFQRVNFNIVGVPNARLKALKAMVMERVGREIASGVYPQGTYVSTGDVVQALSMMMVTGAEKKRALAMAPKSNIVLAQIPGVPSAGSKKYFGNSVHLIKVNFDQKELKNDEKSMESLEVLTRLAVRIRQRTLAYRNSPTEALQGLFETEEISRQPVLKALGFLAGQRFPFVNCTTNYIGTLKEDSELSFGSEGVTLNSACQWLVTPLARDMVVVRPHEADDSLLFMLALTPKDSKRLRKLKLLDDLVKDVKFF